VSNKTECRGKPYVRLLNKNRYQTYIRDISYMHWFQPQAVVLEPKFFNTRRSNIARKVILLSIRKFMIAYFILFLDIDYLRVNNDLSVTKIAGEYNLCIIFLNQDYTEEAE